MLLLSKFLQVIGLIISVAGLVGDNKLLGWEVHIRQQFKKNNFEILFISFTKKTRDYFGDNLLSLMILSYTLLFIVLCYFLPIPSDPLEIPILEAITSLFRSFSDFVYLSASIFCLFVSAFIIVGLVYWYPIRRTINRVQRINKHRLSSYPVKEKKSSDSMEVTLAEILGLLGPFLMMFFVIPAGIICIVFYVSIIVLYSILILLLRISILPYQILDMIANKYRLKSTVLLLGVSVELLGIILS